MKSGRKIIGINIAQARERAGLTQSDLARKVEMTTKSLSQIENGHTQARASNLEAIARALNIDVSDLMNESSLNGAGSVDFAFVSEFLAKFSDLSPARKNFVLALVYRDSSYVKDPVSRQAFLALHQLK